MKSVPVKTPTIKDVARHANVSISTVSSVIHEKNGLYSMETARRVRKVIRQIGYTPNVVARNLVQRKTRTLGIVAEAPYHLLTDNYFFSTILSGVIDEASLRGYQTKVIVLRGDQEVGMHHLEDGSVDGIAVFLARLDCLLGRWALETSVPVVNIGNLIPGVPFPCISVDDDSVRFAVEHLLAQGHRRIGAVIARNHHTSETREQSIRTTLKKAGIMPEESWFYNGDYNLKSGAEAANYFAGIGLPVSALVCINDFMAVGAMNEFTTRGIRVPEDISIVGFDDFPGAVYTRPPLTTIRQPMVEIGRRSASLLIEQILSGTREAIQIRFPGELIERESTRPMASDPVLLP